MGWQAYWDELSCARDCLRYCRCLRDTRPIKLILRSSQNSVVDPLIPRNALPPCAALCCGAQEVVVEAGDTLGVAEGGGGAAAAGSLASLGSLFQRGIGAAAAGSGGGGGGGGSRAEVWALKDRAGVLAQLDAPPVVLHRAEAERHKFPFEVRLRQQQQEPSMWGGRWPACSLGLLWGRAPAEAWELSSLLCKRRGFPHPAPLFTRNMMHRMRACARCRCSSARCTAC